jgi:hypothetical protein
MTLSIDIEAKLIGRNDPHKSTGIGPMFSKEKALPGPSLESAKN